MSSNRSKIGDTTASSHRKSEVESEKISYKNNVVQGQQLIKSMT